MKRWKPCGDGKGQRSRRTDVGFIREFQRLERRPALCGAVANSTLLWRPVRFGAAESSWARLLGRRRSLVPQRRQVGDGLKQKSILTLSYWKAAKRRKKWGRNEGKRWWMHSRGRSRSPSSSLNAFPPAPRSGISVQSHHKHTTEPGSWSRHGVNVSRRPTSKKHCALFKTANLLSGWIFNGPVWFTHSAFKLHPSCTHFLVELAEEEEDLFTQTRITNRVNNHRKTTERSANSVDNGGTW